uniref:C-1-tetrahydrofolate synthase, cytoplasmic n=1 Tax=Hirondellea gigas TaxID=1518452 RepID=A0A6A7GBL6_9CRUS
MLRPLVRRAARAFSTAPAASLRPAFLSSRLNVFVSHEADPINGNVIAKEIRQEIRQDVFAFQQRCGRFPGLAVLLIGERKDSQTYVRMKQKACDEVGITSSTHLFSDRVDEETILDCINDLNHDSSVDGILVQLPLPSHLNEKLIIASCSKTKDVDGLHPANVGQVLLEGSNAGFVPCTPRGCIELIKRSGCSIEGKHAVVLGRSNIVGKPVSLLLQAENATVTMCHSRTIDLPSIVRSADIVVAAIGKPNFVKGDWIKPGATVIDVGINVVDDPTRKCGYRLVGDVDFNEVRNVAGALTPVPGGVGPMTIAMLLSNTLKSAEASVKRQTKAKHAC